MAVSIRIESLVKVFGSLRAVDSVSLTIEPGELFFLLGPSGCGKTTLLRSIAGFHQPESGSVFIGDREVTHLPPHRRETGMVFQNYALWPHLSVAENVAFGLEMRGVKRPEIRRRVAEALERVHMSDRAATKPGLLSGGQQQRVALARALVIEPQCLLLDEPLSNLDAKLRVEMRVEIRRICKQAGLTAVYVTHDQKEALSAADRMAVLRDGRVEQVGTPSAVYRRPANRFVAGFIGEANFVDGTVAEAAADSIRVDTPLGFLTAGGSAPFASRGTPVTLCIRPEAIRLDPPPTHAPNGLHARLRHTVYQGEVAQHALAMSGNGDATVEWKASELNPVAATDRAAGEVACWIAPQDVIPLPR